MNENQLQMILNSLGGGPMAQRLINSNMDPGVLRPWLGPDGRSYITVNNGYDDSGKPKYRNLVTNTPALLRREDWLAIDRAVSWQSKQRLQFWKDLYAEVPRNIPNGMGTLALGRTVGDGDADAIVSMDPVRRSERSRPVLDFIHIPLPVTHSDGSFTAREIAVSRRGGVPLDTTNIGLAARKIGEVIEQMALGTSASYSFAGGTIYGATNFPGRLTMTFTSPEGGGYAFTTLITELLTAIQALENNRFFGPYNLYHSNAWSMHFDRDYSSAYPGVTVGDRVKKITKIKKVQNLDYLTGFQLLLIQMTPDVVQAINGMDFTTVQWEEHGGMELNFKVMAIQVPDFKTDFSGKTGILHGTATAPTTTTTTTSTTTTTTTTTP